MFVKRFLGEKVMARQYAIKKPSDMCIPADSADAARREFDSLERWLYSPKANALDLNSVELGEERMGRELLRLLLQAHVEGRGAGDVGDFVKITKGKDAGKILSHKRRQERTLVTIFGEIRMTRMAYGKRGEDSFHPLDVKLKLPGRCYSYEMQRRLVRHAIQGPFDEAITSVYESTGVNIPKRAAEEILIDASADFETFYNHRKGGSGTGGKSAPILVGSVDCKGVPMIKSELTEKKVRLKRGEKAQKKKMATVAAVFTQEPRIRTPDDVVESLFNPEKKAKVAKSRSKPQNKRVWASLEAGKDAFIKDVHAEMKRRDPSGKKVHVVVTDGERALQIRVTKTIKGAVVVLDLLHVLEKIWAAAHALHGEGTKAAVDFSRERTLRILQGDVGQVVKGLRQTITKRGIKGAKKEKLEKIANYLYKNRSRMKYHEYLAEGLPIASGSVEGACKNLVKDRMERSGMRWSKRTAEAMLKMRATHLSGDFDEYWQFHISQDQVRLYPEVRAGRWKPSS